MNDSNYSILLKMVVLSALVGCASAAVAQDSTSRNSDLGSGLPGDAVGPWGFGLGQRASYVVDLSPLTTSMGDAFGIAPVMKSGKTSTSRFTALNGASAISALVKQAAPYPASSYTLWNAATAGLNPAENNTSLNTSVTPAGQATVFGIGLMDFDEITVGTANVFTNQLYAGLVAFDPALPTRLYITRITAATNSTLNNTDRSQFGFGSIDADGNLVFRADGFNAAGPAASVLQGDNYFRIKSPLRGSTVNLIDNNGGSNSASTDWVLQQSPDIHATPTALPANAGGQSIIVGADLRGNARLETATGIVSSATHRPGTLDQRGNPTFTGRALFSGSVGTCGILTRSPFGNGNTDSFSLWGVNSIGATVNARTISIPSSLNDPCIGYSWSLAGGDFKGYESQAIFRGGAGPVAITRDQAGRALAASVVYNGTIAGPSNPLVAIAVARFDPAVPNSPVTWTAAAWIDPSLTAGKAIMGDFGADGAPLTGDAGEGDGVVDALDAPIGRLAALTENPFALPGPSISSPAFDAAGNLYFIASVSLRKLVGTQVANVPGTALIRARYQPDTFCYTLEVVLEVGSTFIGMNSQTPYQVQALSLADSDSAATPSIWSSSATQQAWNNADSASLPTNDARQLGGLVVSSRICYDVNANGVFEDPTVPGNNTTSPDEAYNVVLYIGNAAAQAQCGTADFNNDGDSGTDQDIEAFFACLAGNCCPLCQSADFNADGDTGTDADIEAFFRVLAGGNC